MESSTSTNDDNNVSPSHIRSDDVDKIERVEEDGGDNTAGITYYGKDHETTTPTPPPPPAAAIDAVVASSSSVSSDILPTNRPSSSETTPTIMASGKIVSSNNTTEQQHEDNKGDGDDIIEQTLGITEYLTKDGNDDVSSSWSSSSSSYGFSGVVKARYSDFLVHEIHLDGTCARLTSTTIPPSSSIVKESALPEAEPNGEESITTNTKEEKDEARGVKTHEVDDVKSEEEEGGAAKEATRIVSQSGASSVAAVTPDLASQLAELINDSEIAKNVMTMLGSHGNDAKDGEAIEYNQTKFVTLPPLEKVQRTMVHEWVRNSLTKVARADTLDGRIRIWHIKFEREMPNYKTFGTSKRLDGGTDNGRRKNSSSSNKKARQSWPADRPDYLQFVLYKENLDTTTATRELSQRGSRARIGYAGMKDKRGITTQFCTLYRTTPDQIVSVRQQQGGAGGGGGHTKQKGYSVVQVGNFEYVPNELQLGMLQGNRFDIVLRNVQTFQQQDGIDVPIVDSENQRKVLQTAAQAMKDSGFINYFGTQRFGKFNDTHLVGIQVLKGNFREAVDILLSPKTDDRPDVANARLEWQQRFKYGENKDNERTAAHRVLKRFNRFMTAETAIVQCLSRHPMEYKRAFGCIPKNLRMMFIHAVQSLIWNKAASYRIRDMDRTSVVVGDLVTTSSDPAVGEESSSKSPPAVHIVTEADVDENKFTIEDVVIPLVGNKTVYPTNALGDIIKLIVQDRGVTMDQFRKIQDRDMVVNGDYRKVICCPRDLDYTIQEYYDPLQPLLQTDLMKLQGIDIVVEPKKDNEKTKLAMIVGFTLPSSSYATIALRELMKRPTSNEFQKELKLE